MSGPSWFSYVRNDSFISPDYVESPCIPIKGVPLDWSGRGTSHVDFKRSEELPLVQGRFLGYGIHGGVYETTCNGNVLAWKRKFCRAKIGREERREIEIIKRLDHRHIIKLVGTYTQAQFLGLLLWPVATCDLASLIDDVDWLQKQDASKRAMSVDSLLNGSPSDENSEHGARLQALGVWKMSLDDTRKAAVAYMDRSMGCIVSAVAYLHKTGIKHKDLKPSNILLSPDGLWLTDFGTATDFSVLTQSATESGERGTPKYFAPEVAAYEPSGRSADIFSLGCIFLEMITLSVGYTLQETQSIRPKNDKAFHSNLDTIIRWFNLGRIGARTISDTFFMGLIRSMIAANPAARPTPARIEEEIVLINGFTHLEVPSRFCGPCCAPKGLFCLPPITPTTCHGDMTIMVGNTYMLKEPRLHTYTFTVEVSRPDIVDKVHIFVHQSFPTHHRIIKQPPFEFRGQGWGSFEIGVYVVLRERHYWDHPWAQPVPRGTGPRMLPLTWYLLFDENPVPQVDTFKFMSS